MLKWNLQGIKGEQKQEENRADAESTMKKMAKILKKTVLVQDREI